PGEQQMRRHLGNLLVGILAAASLAGLNVSAVAESAPANFAPNADIGWYSYNRQFLPPLSGPGPVEQNPERPYVSNDEFRVSGKHPTAQLAALSTPILEPWARDVGRRRKEFVFGEKPPTPPWASCWPVGVPAFILRPMTEPMYFIQAP